MANIVERYSCGIRYGVDPASASDIYLDKQTIQELQDGGHKLSVSGMSAYLKARQSTFSPVLLNWDMISKCNFNCPFCYIRNNTESKDIRFSDVRKILEALISEGLFEAYLSGGECLLLDDFIDIYTYLKKNGVFITVFTNGSLIDERHFQCWKELPPSSVEITLYDNNFLSKPFENILKLREMGLHVQPKFTLTNNTFPYFEDVKQWAIKHKFELMVDTELFDGSDVLHTNIASRYSLSLEEKKLLNPNRYKEVTTVCSTRAGLPCKAKQGTVHLNSELSLALCHKMKKRWDLKNISVRRAISGLQQLIDRYANAKIHGCNGCIYSKMCDMCFVSAINKDGELYVPEGHCEHIYKYWSQY